MTTTTDFEPGTVALATVDGLPNRRVMRFDGGDGGWMYATSSGWEWRYDTSGSVTDVRPLVVLDLEDPQGAARGLRETFNAAKHLTEWDCVEQIADQIEAQTKPPRIPEPGPWGVVAVNGRNYVHTTEHIWRSGGYTATWDDIADGAVLVREGIDD